MCLCYSSSTLFREERSLWRRSSLTRFDTFSSPRISWPMSFDHMQGYNSSFPLIPLFSPSCPSLPLFISLLPFPLSLSPLRFSFFFFPCYLLRLFVSSFRASSLSVRHSSAPPLPPSPPSPPHSINTSFQLLTSIANRLVCLSVCLFLSLLS